MREMYLTISTRRSVSEAHRYFKSFLQYIQKKFPMNDEVMDNAAVWQQWAKFSSY